ncbi:GNAT family N-acetyltransferase [Rhizobiales bacterium RZME27]|uniref:GNAT family N-acetyltransferase n=1 Tax=Endobacterium cereale TaxID=2663029 RepID=A0A6A8AFN8_9HYPH|nr:GNAT family N-acetyltransferase [Endobacterium cereale]MEB2844157.1 GNAT family N-acetyltransferase [Endobacterium cereale]MQY48570.1 GNAT family N-acetyltransferase [Endobacterium cereale]
MPDMLVNLYASECSALAEKANGGSAIIRTALAPEMHVVVEWVRKHFSDNWASEVSVAFSRQPIACLIAVDNGQLLGFACYDTTARGFFGPTGVAEEARGRGIGLALFSDCLQTMKTIGHAYAFIGDAGPVDFYKSAVDAIEIPARDKGLYEGMLRRPKKQS